MCAQVHVHHTHATTPCGGWKMLSGSQLSPPPVCGPETDVGSLGLVANAFPLSYLSGPSFLHLCNLAFMFYDHNSIIMLWMLDSGVC